MKVGIQKYNAHDFVTYAEPFLLIDRQIFARHQGLFRDSPLPPAALQPALPESPRHRAPWGEATAQYSDGLRQVLDGVAAARAGGAPTGNAAGGEPPPPRPTEGEETSDLVSTINFLLDDILGLDSSAKLVEVVASRTTDENGLIAVQIRYGPGAWPTELIEAVSSIEIFSFDLDPARLARDHDYVFELEAEIKAKLDGFVESFIDSRTAGIEGPARVVASAAAQALKDLVASQILSPLSSLLSDSLLDLELPERGQVTSILGGALDALGADYFKSFVPGVAKTYAKLGLSQILTMATADLSPDWAVAVNNLGNGVVGQVLDNLITGYFAEAGSTPIGTFDNINFSEQLGNVLATLLVDFEAIDQEFVDDVLGLDGGNWIEDQLGALLNQGIRGFVQDQFVNAIDFLGGDFGAFDLENFFDNFIGQFDVVGLLSQLIAHYSPTDLAELFVDIDSLPEALLSELGSAIGSAALGEALGTLTMDAVAGLFGQVTANAIGATIFNGLGTLLGAGIGAVAGSVVFELLDDLFDGAISDLIEGILEWIRNDSPQAYYQTVYDPILNEFHWSGYEYSKDGSNDLRLAVKSTMEAFNDKINDIIDFIDEPVSLDQYYNDIFFVWGKKHYNESFATFIGSTETMRVSQNPSAEYVAKETLGLVLSHMNFHTGNTIIARAYDLWKADVAVTAAGSALAYFAPDALLDLQNLVGLARFANDYRQDPTSFDILMGSDAPIAITILQQYLLAEAKGFNAATTLRGSVLGLETIGSAAAGDTIYLDGPAWRAIARGGDDVIYAGVATVQEVDGGAGIDILALAKSRDAYVVTQRGDGRAVLSDAAGGIQITIKDVEIVYFNGVAMAFGTAFPYYGSGGNDTMRGDAGIDHIFGNDGADLIESGGGADIVYGGAGDDRILGGAGDDRLGGDSGDDRLEGGSGADSLYGWDGDDLLQGGGGGDLLLGDAGNDILEGDAGDDSLWGYADDDTLRGGEGNDGLNGEAGNDLLSGGIGNDTLIGGDGQDWMQGDEGADTQRGGAGHDSVWGGAGDDVLGGGLGDDTICGNDGNDTVSYAGAIGIVEVDLALLEEQDTRGAGWDTLVSIENVIGSDFDDVLRGNDQANRLTGGLGADQLVGGGGADIFAYAALTDSTTAAGDLILDFGAGDRIDLSGIDADGGTPGDQAFHFGLTAARTGDLWVAFDVDNNRTGVMLYVDGDSVADAVVWLVGDQRALTPADFIF